MTNLGLLEPFRESSEAVRSGFGRLGRWLEGPVPLRPLAIYRIGFSLLLAANAGSWLPHTAERFSSQGFHVSYLPSDWIPSPALAQALVVTVLVASLALAAGLLSRLANLVLLGAWGYLYAVDQIGEKAIDSIVLVVLAIMLFIPSGRSLGLDAWLFGRREKTGGFAPRLLQLEFVQIYFFTGLNKLLREPWRTGETLYYALQSRWARSWTPPFAVSMSDDLLLLLSWSTILFELGIGFFLMRRAFCVPARLACLTFHGSIQALLGIGFLGPHFMWATANLYRRSLQGAGRDER